MSIPIPVLDDRSYEQLRAELLRRAAVYAPEWDAAAGASDPGVTLLELVAFLGENLLYRFNQIPDQTQLWLLRLLQVPPLPARSARGLVSFSVTGDTDPPPAVPLGTVLHAGAVDVTVRNDVQPLPLSLTGVVKAGTEGTVEDVEDVVGDGVPAYYAPRVLAAEPAGAEPLDVGLAVDRTLWVAVRGVPGEPVERARAALAPGGPLATQPLVLGVVLAQDEAGAADPVPVTGCCGEGQDTGAGLHWQASAKQPLADGLPEYVDLQVARDTTGGLVRDGVVALTLPASQLERLGVAPPDDDELLGVGPRPPVLEDDGGPVLLWLRAFPAAGGRAVGRLRWLGPNAADVVQTVAAAPELLGLGTGAAHQAFALTRGPVVPGTLVVEVEEHGDWVPWEVVDTLAASGRADRHVVLDPVDASVRCGDSVRGRTFGIGDRVRATRYEHGGGRAGNVAAGAVASVDGIDGLAVTNPVALAGGEDAETLERALERIPGELGRRDRAVTADDVERLATVPGVGRAVCLPRFDPRPTSAHPHGTPGAAGVVTVVVWPVDDPAHPDAPRPDASLLRQVCCRLEARRLVTTELYVVPPTYHPVAVSVGLAVRRGHSAVAVRRWVEVVLRQYLSPLPPYGPEGRGWPLGHRVHGPELEAAVLQVEGVDYLEDLQLADLAGPAVPSAPVRSVDLELWEVPEVRALTVVVGPPPAPGADVTPDDPGPDGPPPGGPPVPVPVPPVRGCCS